MIFILVWGLIGNFKRTSQPCFEKQNTLKQTEKIIQEIL